MCYFKPLTKKLPMPFKPLLTKLLTKQASLTAALAICLLSACASGVQPTPPALEQLPAIRPQASLLQAPQSLPQPANGSLPELEANHRQVAKAYHLLAAQLCSLLAFLESPCQPTPPTHD